MGLFPGSLAAAGTASASDTLAAAGHTSLHNTGADETRALGAKMGTGASTPTSGVVLRGNGVGSSSWSQVILTSDVSGVLPQANGGTGTTSATGTGAAVYQSSPTIVTPTIASFANANHNHSNSAGGGTLGTNAVPTVALQNASVTADKLSTGVAADYISTDQSTTSTSYVDLATVGPVTSVTIGANGLALVFLTTGHYNSLANNRDFMSFAISGATTQAAADATAVYGWCNVATNGVIISAIYLVSGLTPGVNTFTAKYKTNANQGNFYDRRITVLPL